MRGKVEARVPEDILQRLSEECERNNMTMSEYVRCILTDYITGRYIEEVVKKITPYIDQKIKELKDIKQMIDKIDKDKKDINQTINKIYTYIDQQIKDIKNIDQILNKMINNVYTYIDQKIKEHTKEYTHYIDIK